MGTISSLFNSTYTHDLSFHLQICERANLAGWRREYLVDHPRRFDGRDYWRRLDGTIIALDDEELDAQLTAFRDEWHARLAKKWIAP